MLRCKLSFENPPRPRLTLRVAVTAPSPVKRLSRARKDTTAARIADALGLIEDGARGLLSDPAVAWAYDGQAPLLRLVSTLAQDAGRLAARAALDRGWSLEAVLPFERKDYEEDFATLASKKEFRALLDEAHAVFSLAMPHDTVSLQPAYEAAGQILLDNCDLLIAVSGDPEPGSAGGSGILALAAERNIPVLRITTSSPPVIEGRGPAGPLDSLPTLLSDLVAPPTQSEALVRFYREGDSGGAANDGIVLGWWRAARAVARFAGWFDGIFLRKEIPKPLPDPVSAPSLTVNANLRHRHTVADAISTHLGHVYRSGFTINFLCSALAVMAGLFAVFWWEQHPPIVKLVCVVLELFFIGIIIAQTWRGRKYRKWHERWLETRRLAEFLRYAGDLTLLGGAGQGSPPTPSPDDRDSGWTAWYARASLREIGLPRAQADAGYLVQVIDHAISRTIDGQIAYHAGNAARLPAVHRGLDHIGHGLFGLTVGIGVLYLAAAEYFSVPPDRSGQTYEWFKPAVTFFSAGLPALGAALYGIRAQSDYETAASRSAETRAWLEDIRERLLKARENPSFARIRPLLTEAAEAMLTDLSDWRRIYRHRPIAIP